MKTDSLPVTTIRTWDRVISAVAYFTFIPAGMFLLVGLFRKSRLVRFHSLQSIFLSVLVTIAAVCVRAVFLILSFAPSTAFLVGWLLAFIVTLGFFLTWLVLIFKALQGRMFELPVLGKVARKQSA